jgi:hypothetical protein
MTRLWQKPRSICCIADNPFVIPQYTRAIFGRTDEDVHNGAEHARRLCAPKVLTFCKALVK